MFPSDDSEDLPSAGGHDYRPLLLLPITMFAGWIMVGDASTWATLTIAGLGMGFILFVVASGLSLVFGLMGVMNFAHGMLMTLGAVAGAKVLYSGQFSWLLLWYRLDHPAYNAMAVVLLCLFSIAICLPAGWLVERVLIRPAGKDVLKQIMLTATGGLIINELFIATVGRGVGFFAPPSLAGAVFVGAIAVEKLRLMLVVIGLLVWGGLLWLLHRTRFGLLVRAAVENREMLEALGYRAKHLFVALFSLAVALAALGGLLMGLQQSLVPISMGSTLLPLIFMVLIIGGSGSVTGALLAAVLLGLFTNYVGFAFPLMSTFSGIALMIAIVLWRPRGLYPLNKHGEAI